MPLQPPFGRLSNATPTAIRKDDVLLSARIGGEEIQLGVSDNRHSISRLTWRHPPGTYIYVTFIHPSDAVVRTSNVILDNYPIAKDIVTSTGSSVSSDSNITKAQTKALMKNNK